MKSLYHHRKFDWMLTKSNSAVFRAAVPVPDHKIGCVDSMVAVLQVGGSQSDMCNILYLVCSCNCDVQAKQTLKKELMKTNNAMILGYHNRNAYHLASCSSI